MNTPKKSTTCQVEGCNRKKKAKGYCEKHHYSWVRYQDPLAIEQRKEANKPKEKKEHPKVCVIDGCDGKNVGHGYCSYHLYYYKQNRLEEILHPPTTCVVEGCCLPIERAKQYCSYHYKNIRYERVRERWEDLKAKGLLCQVSSCNKKPMTRGGICFKHEEQEKRRKEREEKRELKKKEKVPVPKPYTCQFIGCNESVFNQYCQEHWELLWKKDNREKAWKEQQRRKEEGMTGWIVCYEHKKRQIVEVIEPIPVANYHQAPTQITTS